MTRQVALDLLERCPCTDLRTLSEDSADSDRSGIGVGSVGVGGEAKALVSWAVSVEVGWLDDE